MRRWSLAPGGRARCKHETPARSSEAIVELRGELERQGHDAGAETIAYHLAQTHRTFPPVSTIWRILRREGLVVPQPPEAPALLADPLRSGAAERDVAGGHHRLAARRGEVVEILNLIDDHSRLFLGSDAYPPRQSGRRRCELPQSRRSCTACRNRCSPTTAPSSRAPIAAARCCSNTSSSASASSSRTHGPITRRPAARSSACTRRSSATWPSSRPRRRSQSSRASSTPSPTTTTTSARTGPSDGRTPLQAYSARMKAQARRRHAEHLLPRARGQGRQDRQGQPALRQPPLQNRPRQSPQGPRGQAPHRRPEHPRDRPQTAS